MAAIRIVSRNGRAGTIGTVAAALELARRAGRPFRIFVEAGLYHETLRIAAPGVTLAGAGPDTIIGYDASAGQAGPGGKPWGTSGSASLTVEAPGVTLCDLTIANSFDFLSSRPSAGRSCPDSRRSRNGGRSSGRRRRPGKAPRPGARHARRSGGSTGSRSCWRW